jgi:hypothetical protein
MSKCIVCGEEAKWPCVDESTGFTFCQNHYDMSGAIYRMFRIPCLANWLHAIADTIIKVTNDRPSY